MRSLWIGCVLLGALVAAPAAAQRSAVILATTTSTQDSGLLDVLVPLFEKKTGYTVKTIAVGTGQSLALGGRGEADVVLVHAPKLELEYKRELKDVLGCSPTTAEWPATGSPIVQPEVRPDTK